MEGIVSEVYCPMPKTTFIESGLYPYIHKRTFLSFVFCPYVTNKLRRYRRADQKQKNPGGNRPILAPFEVPYVYTTVSFSFLNFILILLSVPSFFASLVSIGKSSISRSNISEEESFFLPVYKILFRCSVS